MDYYDPSVATPAAANSGVAVIAMVVYLAIIVFIVASVWRVFAKAGRPGWAALVPFYNTWVRLEIIGRPTWWLILLFIPFVNIVVVVIMALDLARVFGRGNAFAVFGLILFPVVGYPMLAFGKDQYIGPNGSAAVPTPAAPTPAA